MHVDYSRFKRFDDETFQTLPHTLISYIRSEYVLGPAEAEATCKRPVYFALVGMGTLF